MEDFEQGMNLVPRHMQNGVREYILRGRPMGTFGHAIFSNDFVHAWGHADEENDNRMKDWARFLYNCAPVMGSGEWSWGSKEAVEKWQEAGGMEGIKARNTARSAAERAAAGEQNQAPPAPTSVGDEL